MNREIKFRGKDIKTGKWIYGDVHFNADCSKAHIHERGQRVASFDVDPKTVGQYTGLKDKNSKEIYEGDILKTENMNYGYGDPSQGEYVNIVVRWSNGEACFLAGDLIMDFNLDYYEIIGNIYENEELLK